MVSDNSAYPTFVDQNNVLEDIAWSLRPPTKQRIIVSSRLAPFFYSVLTCILVRFILMLILFFFALQGGVEAGGKIYGIPCNAREILEYDPSTGAITGIDASPAS